MSGLHTPGPWSVHKGFPMYVVPADQAGRPIGAHTDLATDRTMFAHEIAICDRSANRIPKSQRKANAHLISAAPELLEALIAVVKVADRATVEFDAARAAIAKATGAQP